MSEPITDERLAVIEQDLRIEWDQAEQFGVAYGPSLPAAGELLDEVKRLRAALVRLTDISPFVPQGEGHGGQACLYCDQDFARNGGEPHKPGCAYLAAVRLLSGATT